MQYGTISEKHENACNKFAYSEYNGCAWTGANKCQQKDNSGFRIRTILWTYLQHWISIISKWTVILHIWERKQLFARGFVIIFAWRLVWHIWTLFLKLIAATKLYLAPYFCSLYLCITAGTKLAWQSVRIIFHCAQLIKIVACSTWHASRLSGPCFPIALAHSTTVGQSFVLPNAPRMHQRQKLYDQI